MTPDDKRRLEEIRGREKKATPGPWDRHERNSNYPQSVVVETSRLTIAKAESYADIDYIAHSRTDIPYLLDLVQRLEEEVRLLSPLGIGQSLSMSLRTENARLREALDKIEDTYDQSSTLDEATYHMRQIARAALKGEK